MLDLGNIRKVVNGYSGPRNNPFSPQPLFKLLNEIVSKVSGSSDDLGMGLSTYMALLTLWRTDRNSFNAFKRLDAEFDATIALFEFLPQLQLAETTANGHGYAELHRLFNWIEDEQISAVKLNEFLKRLDAEGILNRNNIRDIIRTRAWSMKENVAAVRTPVSFLYTVETVEKEIKFSETVRLPLEEKQNFLQKSFNSLFVNHGNRLNFRPPGF